MRIAHAPGQLERQPRAVAIGTFDGVHRGHLSVIQAAVDSGLAPTVITFDPHPRVAFGNEVELITTLERRLELFDAAGVESTLVAPFTTELMALEPEMFAERYLTAIGATAIAAGPNFRFGSKRRGDRGLLGELGFEILDVEPIPDVSSSSIRRMLREGDVGGAAALLGPPVRARRRRRRRRPAGRHARLPDREPRTRAAPRLPVVRHLRGLRTRAQGGDLDWDESALRWPRATHRAVPARLRRRSLRQATHRRGLGAATGRGGVRIRGRPRCPDRPRRRRDPSRNPAVAARLTRSGQRPTPAHRCDGTAARIAACPGPRVYAAPAVREPVESTSGLATPTGAPAANATTWAKASPKYASYVSQVT